MHKEVAGGTLQGYYDRSSRAWRIQKIDIPDSRVRESSLLILTTMPTDTAYVIIQRRNLQHKVVVVADAIHVKVSRLHHIKDFECEKI